MKLLDKLRNFLKSATYRPHIGEHGASDPAFSQMLEEWSKWDGILERSTLHEKQEALEKFLKLITSRAFFALCINHEETISPYYEMITAANRLLSDLQTSLRQLALKSSELVSLLSNRAGRRLPPIISIETVTFLCDQLRKADRSGSSSYLVLNSEGRPTGSGQREYDLICAEDGCGSIESVVLSEETLTGLDQHERIWLCCKHLKRNQE